VDDWPQLLDVVPWNYGFAHAWALRWLIGNPASRTRVLNLLGGEDRGSWDLTQPVVCEHRLQGARADVAVWANGDSGPPVSLAVEVKVNDPINAAQLAAYQQGGFSPVLYLPGLTGLMCAPNGPAVGERWVTGAELAEALGGVTLPPMVASYADAVAAEAQRMELARAFSRDEVDDFPHEGQTRYDDLMDAAWIAEVALAMRERGAEDILVRPETNDRHLRWHGCRRVLASGAELYVVVVADLRTHHCVIALKVKGGDLPARQAAYEQVLTAGPPSEAGWRRGRRSAASSGRIWTLDASELNASETADHALAVGEFIARFGDRLS
jgi:hypothetical protein